MSPMALVQGAGGDLGRLASLLYRTSRLGARIGDRAALVPVGPGQRVWFAPGCRDRLGAPGPSPREPMPYKFNESRRHKIPEAKYRVTNWPEYDAALVRRGSLTVWFTEGAVAAWHAPATGERGGQPIYSPIAIETGLALRLVVHQPLRQTEGLLRSIADALGIDIAVPDYTTLSCRIGGMTILPKRIDPAEPLHLLVDSTGLKILGEGECLDQKHGIRACRKWRKLHLGVEANTREIVAVELTTDDVGDVTELPRLLDQIDGGVASMTGDGAYVGEAVYSAVAERHPEASVMVPPRATAVRHETTASQRDRHLSEIERHGRIGW